MTIGMASESRMNAYVPRASLRTQTCFRIQAQVLMAEASWKYGILFRSLSLCMREDIVGLFRCVVALAIPLLRFP